jgi:hypothetical protein
MNIGNKTVIKAYVGDGNLRIALSTRTTVIKRDMFEINTISKKHEKLDKTSLRYLKPS